MSEDAARNWFNGTETVETSIAQLVSEMKDYVDNKTDDFRLLFMVDEVGQYVGGDTDLLINLQSLVEKSAVSAAVRFGLFVPVRKLLMKSSRLVKMSFLVFRPVSRPDFR